MISGGVVSLKAFLAASVLHDWPPLLALIDNAIDLFTGPLTGERTRFYWVFVLESLLVAVIFYAVSGGLRRAGWGGFTAFCFPRRFFLHRSTWVDCTLNLFNGLSATSVNILWRWNATFFTGWLLGGLTAAFGPAPHLFGWNLPLLLCFTVLSAAASDFGFYVFHYIAHKVPAVWAFHKVHHSAEVLTPLVSGRLHPLEVMVTQPFRMAAEALVLAPAIYLFAGEPSIVTIFGISVFSTATAAIGSGLLHSHMRITYGPLIERVIMSPAQHQIHHSVARHHWDTNLGGVFSLWDWMFGTLYLPRADEREITFGVAPGVPMMHTGLLTALFLPFWEAIPGHRRLATRLLAGRSWQARTSAANSPATLPPG